MSGKSFTSKNYNKLIHNQSSTISACSVNYFSSNLWSNEENCSFKGKQFELGIYSEV